MEKARFKWVLRERNRKIAAKTEAFTEQQARRVRSFHSSFKEYSPTPLIELTSLAQHFGIKNLFVKDESYRFGLNAFKVLGGSFAIGSYIANEFWQPCATFHDPFSACLQLLLLQQAGRSVCAGSVRQRPCTSKREPWHGQSQLLSSGFHSNRQPRCGQRSSTA